MYCKFCGKEIADEAVMCPHCGSMLTARPTPPPAAAESNWMAIVGFILSFFIPIAGLVLSIFGKNRAREMGGTGETLAKAGIVISAILIGLTVLSAILGIVFWVTGALGLFGFLGRYV